MNIFRVAAGLAIGAAAGFGIGGVLHRQGPPPGPATMPPSKPAVAKKAGQKPLNPPKSTTVLGLIQEFEGKDGEIPPMNITAWRLDLPVSLRLIDSLLAELTRRSSASDDTQARLWLARRLWRGDDFPSFALLTRYLSQEEAVAVIDSLEASEGRAAANAFGAGVMHAQFEKDPATGLEWVLKISAAGRIDDNPEDADLPGSSEKIPRHEVRDDVFDALFRLKNTEAVSFLEKLPPGLSDDFMAHGTKWTSPEELKVVKESFAARQHTNEPEAKRLKRQIQEDPPSAADAVLHSQLQGADRLGVENTLIHFWAQKEPMVALKTLFPRRAEFQEKEAVASLLTNCLEAMPKSVAGYAASLPAGKDRDDLITAIQAAMDTRWVNRVEMIKARGVNGFPGSSLQPSPKEGFGFDPAPLRALVDQISDPALKTEMKKRTPAEKR